MFVDELSVVVVEGVVVGVVSPDVVLVVVVVELEVEEVVSCVEVVSPVD